MTDALAHIAVWLNAVANGLGRPLLAPIGWLPGWLSATLVAAVTGVLLLVVFKYTSNQPAIKRARDDIKAHLLALKLFKESTRVTFRAQGRILWGAARLFLLAIVPMLVMVVPVSLLWGQMALWYQARPLATGEEAVMTLKLNGGAASVWPDVRLQPTDTVEVVAGPVRIESKREVCWNLRARQEGRHRLVLEVGGQPDEKELAVGGSFMRTSAQRPGWNWSEILVNPAEQPFGPESAIQSISIDYPERDSWTSGADWWVVYWFFASMAAAFLFRPWLNVNL